MYYALTSKVHMISCNRVSCMVCILILCNTQPFPNLRSRPFHPCIPFFHLNWSHLKLSWKKVKTSGFPIFSWGIEENIVIKWSNKLHQSLFHRIFFVKWALRSTQIQRYPEFKILKIKFSNIPLKLQVRVLTDF